MVRSIRRRVDIVGALASPAMLATSVARAQDTKTPDIKTLDIKTMDITTSLDIKARSAAADRRIRAAIAEAAVRQGDRLA